MTCARYSGRNGLTLLEVVAGIALLSAMLVLVLQGIRHLAEQDRKADLVLQATALADQLLASWQEIQLGIRPAAAAAANDKFVWESQLIERPDLAVWGIRLVRLSIHAKEDRHGQPQGALVTVDFLAADPHWQAPLSPNVQPETSHAPS